MSFCIHKRSLPPVEMTTYLRDTTLGWYQFLSFPLGSLVGVHHEKVNAYVKANERKALLCAVLVFIGILVYKSGFSKVMLRMVPYPIFSGLSELISVGIVLSLSVITWRLGTSKTLSVLLGFAGSISYELYLVHGPLLVKYNLVGLRKNLVLQFLMNLVIISAFAGILKLAAGKIGRLGSI